MPDDNDTLTLLPDHYEKSGQAMEDRTGDRLGPRPASPLTPHRPVIRSAAEKAFWDGRSLADTFDTFGHAHRPHVGAM
jgi:hypothetical protein